MAISGENSEPEYLNAIQSVKNAEKNHRTQWIISSRRREAEAMTKAICRAYAVAVIAAKLPWLTIDGVKGGRAMQISSAFQLKLPVLPHFHAVKNPRYPLKSKIPLEVKVRRRAQDER